MTRHTLRIAALAAVVAGLLTAASASTHANTETARMQYLTFSKPVALPGVALHPGTYVFELPAPDSARDIVRVMSRDRRTVYFTAYTRTVDRPAGTPDSQLVSLREVAPDQPMPISVWWSDVKTGRQFIY